MATAAVAPSPQRPSSAAAHAHDAVVLPPLPEAQAARPPTAPGRRPPEDDAARQVPDDYFTLPRIETATRMLEDPNPYQPPQAAVSTRVPGDKIAKAGEGLDDTRAGGGLSDGGVGTGSLKDRGDAAGADAGVSRSSALDATLDRRSSEVGGGDPHQRPGDDMAGPDASGRVGSVVQEKKAARRGPLPSQARRTEDEKSGFAARLAGDTGKHAGERKGEFSTIGKAHAVTGRDESGEVTVTDESHGFLQTETPEQRLDRIRQSNVRKNFGAKGAGGGDPNDPMANLTRKDRGELEGLNPSSPRRARQADHEFGYKDAFFDELPEMMKEKALRRGQMLAAPYGKNLGSAQGMQALESSEVKMQIRATQLRYVEKAAPDLEQKPPPALSVSALAPIDLLLCVCLSVYLSIHPSIL